MSRVGDATGWLWFALKSFAILQVLIVGIGVILYWQIFFTPGTRRKMRNIILAVSLGLILTASADAGFFRHRRGCSGAACSAPAAVSVTIQPVACDSCCAKPAAKTHCTCGCTVTGECTCKDCDHPQLAPVPATPAVAPASVHRGKIVVRVRAR